MFHDFARLMLIVIIHLPTQMKITIATRSEIVRLRLAGICSQPQDRLSILRRCPATIRASSITTSLFMWISERKSRVIARVGRRMEPPWSYHTSLSGYGIAPKVAGSQLSMVRNGLLVGFQCAFLYIGDGRTPSGSLEIRGDEDIIPTALNVLFSISTVMINRPCQNMYYLTEHVFVSLLTEP